MTEERGPKILTNDRKATHVHNSSRSITSCFSPVKSFQTSNQILIEIYYLYQVHFHITKKTAEQGFRYFKWAQRLFWSGSLIIWYTVLITSYLPLIDNAFILYSFHMQYRVDFPEDLEGTELLSWTEQPNLLTRSLFYSERPERGGTCRPLKLRPNRD